VSETEIDDNQIGKDDSFTSTPDVAGAEYPTGAGNSSGTDTEVPPEIARLRWNWGAFVFAPFWTLAHRLWWWALPLVAILLVQVISTGMLVGRADFISMFGALGAAFPLDFVLRCVLGSSGHQLAWRRRRFPGGLQQFFEVQTVWTRVALAIIGITTVCFAWLVRGLVIGIEAMMRAFAHLH